MKMIDFPNFRQAFTYDCGAIVLQGILAFYGLDMATHKIVRISGTNGKTGTSREGVKKTVEHFGLKFKSKKMTVEELKQFIDKDIPIILELQAWPKEEEVDWKNEWKNSHFVVAIGYDKNKMYFEDPNSVFRTYLTFEELKERWHNIESTEGGKKYHNLGMIITGEKQYDSKKVIHMD